MVGQPSAGWAVRGSSGGQLRVGRSATGMHMSMVARMHVCVGMAMGIYMGVSTSIHMGATTNIHMGASTVVYMGMAMHTCGRSCTHRVMVSCMGGAATGCGCVWSRASP